MRKALRLAAVSCALGIADSKTLKWGENGTRWILARETLAYKPLLGVNIKPPSPTPPPQIGPRDGLSARDVTSRTCAYISGLPESSIWCDSTQHCVSNSMVPGFGCCNDQYDSCWIPTTCVDSTKGVTIGSIDTNFTLFCRDSSIPYCVTYEFQDVTLSGYSMLGCGDIHATKEIWKTPTSLVITTTITATHTSIRTCGSGDSTSSDSCPSPTPVGAIIGGVVGGLAAIALIILCIWALRRQNNKHKREAAEAAEAAAAAQEQQFGKPPPPGALIQQAPPPLQPQPHPPQFTTELPAMRGQGELAELPLPVTELQS
ncbi:hypothetical protein C8A05DRAFT_17673 [Staphylotrichum tortipilum]|uniref:Uncharacterized protein n=1 Tax=Staphylotrichum tortipilum TaxID=2831512 RepID=A0AAN6MHD7_9PEZI|nr:hypothetical protein C8A05DRAFT_17673 [Staphylotrichum longicolle]